MKRILFVGLFFLPVFWAGVSAQGIEYSKLGMNVTADSAPSGLEVGAEAPGFKGKDQYGNDIELKQLLKKGPVVLIFYRGYWCPVCSRYLSQFQDSLSLILERSATVVAVTPETAEFVEKTLEKTKGAFLVVSDSNEQIMDDYDVKFAVTDEYAGRIRTRLNADISSTNGQTGASLPVPATYIIDTDGRIIYRQFDPNYRNRASIREILEHLPN